MFELRPVRPAGLVLAAVTEMAFVITLLLLTIISIVTGDLVAAAFLSIHVIVGVAIAVGLIAGLSPFWPAAFIFVVSESLILAAFLIVDASVIVVASVLFSLALNTLMVFLLTQVDVLIYMRRLPGNFPVYRRWP